MSSKGNRALTFKKIILFELLLSEILLFLVITVYKYYVNLNVSTFLTFDFFKLLIKSYSFFYTGNLIWFLLLLASVSALVKLYISVSGINDRTLKALLFISFILLIILTISILLPTTEIIDEFTGRFIQLNAKGTKIVLMSLYTGAKVFHTAALFTAAFSALRKLYVLRSLWISFIIGFGGIAIVFFSISSFKDDLQKIEQENVISDAGIILGAAVWGGNRPSPILKERINKGYELYKANKIKNIVLTGGGAPGEMTEAEVGKNELLKRGVDAKSILIENQSNSTLQQITYVNKNLYRKNGWDKVLFISDNFHLFRVKQISNFFRMNSLTASSDTPLSAETGVSFTMKETFSVMLFWLFGIG